MDCSQWHRWNHPGQAVPSRAYWLICPGRKNDLGDRGTDKVLGASSAGSKNLPWKGDAILWTILWCGLGVHSLHFTWFTKTIPSMGGQAHPWCSRDYAFPLAPRYEKPLMPELSGMFGVVQVHCKMPQYQTDACVHAISDRGGNMDGKEQHTPDLRSLLLKYLWGRGTIICAKCSTALNMPHIIQEFAVSQDVIGWDSFIMGMVSSKLLPIQSAHSLTSSSSPKATRWISGLITQLLQVTHTQWIYRCILVHDRTTGMLISSHKGELLKEIDHQL